MAKLDWHGLTPLIPPKFTTNVLCKKTLSSAILRSYGKILIDDILLIQAEAGHVVLVEANPEAHRELSSFAALSSKTWNNPAFSKPYLVVRNDREAACYELPLRG